MPRASKAAEAAKKLGKKVAGAKAAKTSSAPKKAAKTAGRRAAAPAQQAKATPRTAKAPARQPAAKAARKGAAKAAAKSTAKVAPADKFLDEQRALLLEERSTYEQQAEALKAEADQLAQEMEPGDIQFDEESGEGAPGNVDRERDLALSAQARAAVEEIDHALTKIDAGTYGTCERCGQPIPRARLKALPYARLCVSCKSGGLSRR